MYVPLIITLFAAAPHTQAASFTIVNGQVVTTQQNLNADKTGTVEAGGQLNVANANVTNSGTISTIGSGVFGIQSTGANATIKKSEKICHCAYGILLSWK